MGRSSPLRNSNDASAVRARSTTSATADLGQIDEDTQIVLRDHLLYNSQRRPPR